MVDDKDERIRLLEFQVEFLRRELTFVMGLYQNLIYSAAWTVARPIKRVEDLLHRGAARFRRPKGLVAPVPFDVASEGHNENLAETIAMRITRRMAQFPSRK